MSFSKEGGYRPPERVESDVVKIAEAFTAKRNRVRTEWLQKILPGANTSRVLRFLDGDVDIVKDRAKEYRDCLGGAEIEILGAKLIDSIRPALEEKFGMDSYLRGGEFLSDESEVLSGDMIDEDRVLQKARWDNPSLLLGDHLGRLRMSALGYRLLDEPKGPIGKVIGGMLSADMEKRLADMAHELEEIPGWLARKGLPKEGPRQKNALERKVERIIVDLSQEKVDALVAEGAHQKIAEAPVLADATRPHEASQETLERIQKRLDDLKVMYPRASKEFERLAPHMAEIVNELINKTALDHLMQSRRFRSRI